MKIIGRVESLWRYPVKSMRGEELAEAFAGFAGVYGDRLFAFRSSAIPKGFRYLTARQAYPHLNWRFAKWGSAQVGYRWLGTDYSIGSGASKFNYNSRLARPAAGLHVESLG